MRWLGELSFADQVRVGFAVLVGYPLLLCVGMGQDSYGQRTKP